MKSHFISQTMCIGVTLFISCCGGPAPQPMNSAEVSTTTPKASPEEPKVYPGLTSLRAAYERIPNKSNVDYLEHGVILEIAKPMRERTIVAELTEALLPCKSRKECPTTLQFHEASHLIKLGFSILGEIGRVESVPALILFDRLGFFEAGMAVERILERNAEEEMSPGSCMPPTPEDVVRAAGRQNGLVVFDWQKDRVIARELLPDEQNAAAYFFAAVLQNGREIKNLRTDVSEAEPVACDTPSPQPMDNALASLSDAADKSTTAHDTPALVRAARTFGDTLFTSKVDVDFEACLGTADPETSADFRDMAALSEAQGLLDAADFLYRVAIPGGGACSTSDDSFWETQVKGLIRVSERAGRCNRIVAERLLSIDGPVEEWNLFDYGPSRLQKAGFDLLRLYRGAVLTRNREYLPLDPDLVTNGLQRALRTRVRVRLRDMGREDWERRTFALEGLLDTLGRPALNEIIDLLPVLHPKSRAPIIAALGEFAYRITVGECKEEEYLVSGNDSSAWRRKVRSQGSACPNRFRDNEADALAEKLAPYLDDKEEVVRRSTVTALKQIASFLSIDALKKKAQSDSVQSIRDAAKDAVSKIDTLFQSSDK
jgi:hypothetical protein